MVMMAVRRCVLADGLTGLTGRRRGQVLVVCSRVCRVCCQCTARFGHGRVDSGVTVVALVVGMNLA